MVKKIEKRLQSFDAYISMALGLAAVLIVGAVVFNLTSKSRTGSVDDKAGETKAEEQAGQNIPLPASHIVADGESLWNIAEKYYQNGYNWSDIARANNLSSPDDIHTGNTLTIPKIGKETPVEGQVSATATGTTEEKQPAAKKYTVKPGDNLWKIAVSEYQDGYKWTEIAKANKLENPDLIHTGNELVLP